jgi:hypothetical protein
MAPPSPSSSPATDAVPPWTTLLDEAATLDDGGSIHLSMPVASDVLERHPYVPPSPEYCRLLYESAGAPEDEAPLASARSAGWLASAEEACPPVFVANSLLSAVWLLRASLPADALEAGVWKRLAFAASTRADESSSDEEGTSQEEEDATRNTRRSKRRRTTREDEAGEGSLPAKKKTAKKKTAKTTKGRTTKTTTTATKTTTATGRRAKKSGLASPLPTAPQAEFAAYHSIQPADEATVAWIFKQPVKEADFYATATTPYSTALAMVEKARKLGNDVSRAHAGAFLSAWRACGSPLARVGAGTGGGGGGAPSSTALVQRGTATTTTTTTTDALSFGDLWDTVLSCEAQLAAVHIQYRWYMACLAKRYIDKVTMLEQDRQPDSGRRQGRGNARSEAKRAMLAEVRRPVSWDAFNTRLKRAMRWYDVTQYIGWGGLCLMPYDVVGTTWAEQTLRTAEWRLWLEEVVQRVNPDVVLASRALDGWLGADGIAGAPIHGREVLRIEEMRTEEERPATARVEEVRDSEDDEGEEGGDEEPPPTQQSGASSVASSSHGASLSLVELFQPLRPADGPS